MLVYYTYNDHADGAWECVCVWWMVNGLWQRHTGRQANRFAAASIYSFLPFPSHMNFMKKKKNIHLFRYIALTRTNQMAHAPLTRACCDLVWRAHYLIHTNGLAIASNQSTERASAAEIHHKAEQKIGMSSNQPKKNWTLTGMSITIALLCKVSWGSILWPIQRYSSCALFFCSTANMFNAQCNA